MPKTIINDLHYDYANNITKLLGFDNLIDYAKTVKYADLDQEIVCTEFTKTVEEFKILFPLTKFDLRKHNYIFSTIDQATGFWKKILLYLDIPMEKVRVSGKACFRLLPLNNKKYIDYINKMSENPQNSIMSENDDISTYTKFSTILEKYSKNTITESYIVPTTFLTDFFTRFFYFTNIKIAVYNEDTNSVEPLPLNTSIKFKIGGDYVMPLSDEITELTTFDNNYLSKDINLPNNQFFKNHCLQVSIGSNSLSDKLYQIHVTGNYFKNIPQSLCDSPIIYDHDCKYFCKNEYQYISVNGTFIRKNIFVRHENPKPRHDYAFAYKHYMDQRNITVERFTIHDVSYNLSIINSNFGDHPFYGNMRMDLLLKDIPDHESIGINISDNMRMVMMTNSTDYYMESVSIYYAVCRYGDMIHSIKLTKDFPKDLKYDIEICSTENTFVDLGTHLTNAESHCCVPYFNVINKQYVNIFVKITTSRKNVKYFKSWLDADIRYVHCCTPMRKILAAIPVS
jgi:hypothetical protein